jgi:hypothetical protein
MVSAQEPLGEGGALPTRHHPAGDVAAVDVEDDVEVVVGPLHRPQQLGDVPAPDPIRPVGDEFGLQVGGMHSLVPTLVGLVLRTQDAIDGRNRGQVAALVQQGGEHARRGHVHETLRVQHVEHVGPFLGAQCPGLAAPPLVP